MRYLVALGVVAAAAGCTETEFVEVEVFACTSHAQCAPGFRCEVDRCVPGERPLDGALPAADLGEDQGAADRGAPPDAVVVRPDASPPPDMAEPLEDAAVIEDAEPIEDAGPPPEPCEADVALGCCVDGEVAQGAPCEAPLAVDCDGGGIAAAVACMPREVVRVQAGTCTAAGACQPDPGGLTWDVVRWCGLERMCGVGGTCGPQRRQDQNGNLITCLGDDWCLDRQEGHPCHMPGQRAYPPTGVCVRDVCVDLDTDDAAATPSGPLTPLPFEDPRPEHFVAVGDGLQLDTRTGLTWRLDPAAQVRSVRDGDLACDGLAPLRPDTPDRWRVPDAYELASLVPGHGIAELLAQGPLVDGPPLLSRSVFNREDGGQSPLLLDLPNERMEAPEGEFEARVVCVYGARRTRDQAANTIDLAAGGLDGLTGQNWGAAGRADPAAVPKSQAACGGFRPVFPNAGTAVGFMRFDGGLRSLFGPPHDEVCFWTASQTPDGGRWWFKPYRGELGVARDEAWRCYVACSQ